MRESTADLNDNNNITRESRAADPIVNTPTQRHTPLAVTDTAVEPTSLTDTLPQAET